MDDRRTRLDLLLDLLSDEVAKRLQARSEAHPAVPPPPPPAIPLASQSPERPAATPLQPALKQTPSEPTGSENPDLLRVRGQAVTDALPSHAALLMLRLAIGILLVVVLINIPLNAQGNAIARSIPNSASLVIGDGLVVKEANSPDVWVYRDNAFHWITSLDAFEYFGYRWQDVHVVEPGFLGQFPKGNPIYVLLKCDSSPHIYRLEGGKKRWIVDIPTFLAEGHVWQDVKFVPCPYLRSLPEGDSIPPGRGSPPPPLP